MTKDQLNKIVQRYHKLAKALDDKVIDKNKLEKRVAKDINLYDALYKNDEITQEDFEKIMVIVHEFESIFQSILNDNMPEIGKEFTKEELKNNLNLN